MRPAHARAYGPRLLLIAADPRVRKRHERALARECIAEVEVASSAAEAVERLLCDRDFSLVLCHGALPDASVTAFLRQLRELRLVACPRLVVFDGSAHPPDVIEAIQLGVLQYLPEPCAPTELAAKVERLLGRSGQPR